jgi:hypothetical protein
MKESLHLKIYQVLQSVSHAVSLQNRLLKLVNVTNVLRKTQYECVNGKIGTMPLVVGIRSLVNTAVKTIRSLKMYHLTNVGNVMDVDIGISRQFTIYVQNVIQKIQNIVLLKLLMDHPVQINVRMSRFIAGYIQNMRMCLHQKSSRHSHSVVHVNHSIAPMKQILGSFVRNVQLVNLHQIPGF